MICAILLAAGRSRRMGRQKLLLPVAGRTVIARVADALLLSTVDRTFVVIREDGLPIRAALAGRPVTFVVNPEPESEMLASVRASLRALPPDCAGAMIVPGDQPGINASFLNALVREFQTGGRGIVVPVYQGQRGHPTIIARRYWEEVLTRFDRVGLRGLLALHAGDVLETPVETPALLADIDLPEDYDRLRRQLEAP